MKENMCLNSGGYLSPNSICIMTAHMTVVRRMYIPLFVADVDERIRLFLYSTLAKLPIVSMLVVRQNITL